MCRITRSNTLLIVPSLIGCMHMSYWICLNFLIFHIYWQSLLQCAESVGSFKWPPHFSTCPKHAATFMTNDRLMLLLDLFRCLWWTWDLCDGLWSFDLCDMNFVWYMWWILCYMQYDICDGLCVMNFLYMHDIYYFVNRIV